MFGKMLCCQMHVLSDPNSFTETTECKSHPLSCNIHTKSYHRFIWINRVSSSTCCCITWPVVCKCSCNRLQSRLWLYQRRWTLLRPRTDCSHSGPNTAGRNHPHPTPAAQIRVTQSSTWSTASERRTHTHTHPPVLRTHHQQRELCERAERDALAALTVDGLRLFLKNRVQILQETHTLSFSSRTHSMTHTFCPSARGFCPEHVFIDMYGWAELFTCILLTSAVMIHTLRIPVTDTATTVSSETHKHTLTGENTDWESLWVVVVKGLLLFILNLNLYGLQNYDMIF